MTTHSEPQGATLFSSFVGSRGASVFIMCVLLIGMVGCSLFNRDSKPSSLGETMSGYTYIPVDPTKVQIVPGECSIQYSEIGDDLSTKQKKLLNLLPDNAVRTSMELSDFSGKVAYGISKVGTTGLAYRLTADYVNSDTVNKAVWIRRTMMVHETAMTYDSSGKVTEQKDQQERSPVSFAEGSLDDNQSIGWFGDKRKTSLFSDNNNMGKTDRWRTSIPGTESFDVKSYPDTPSQAIRDQLVKDKYEEFNVPIYVGIGLRIVAQGLSVSGDANISGIGIIGVEAEAKRLSGSLTVQTLGVNSQAVASALPVQSELSRTTAENAFVSIGSIKAMLHQPETIKIPRVVGLYLPFPGGKPLVNALISELSRNPVTWCPHGYLNKDKVRVSIPIP
ncbi:hypothetical protein AYO43_09190 [Nitrospira sp. SCGC AG-212-E16]|nr:hypothetical protein AYO43_09190 [Nitrospira sp. SCGC AG-212-E16]